MSDYDLVIIGGGPSGLALAQCCSLVSKKILIVEKENDIGGCHRVRRVPININNKIENVFTEHGPRIYSSTYKNVQHILSEIGLDFSNVFTPYNFSISRIGGETIWSTLSFRELQILSVEFLHLILDSSYGKDISMLTFMTKNSFKKESFDIIDRICRLTDGASASKYTLCEFLQLFNQQFFYQIYQPRYPNDVFLFKKWKDFLISRGVDFMFNTNVMELVKNKENNISAAITSDYNFIYGKKFIIATPPTMLVNLLDKSRNTLVKNSFGDLELLKTWSINTNYIDYLPIIFHWGIDLKLDKIYGFPKTEWGVAFIVLSDYMTFNESISKTVISTAVTITHVKSTRINKTPNECNEKDLLEEVFYQLKLSYPNLPYPTVSLLSPGVVFNQQLNKWSSRDTAFISTSNEKNLPFQSETISNLFNVGTHNGKNKYKFTSMEAAVTNGIDLSKLLYPQLENHYIIHSTIQVTDIIHIFIAIIILFILYKIWMKYL